MFAFVMLVNVSHIKFGLHLAGQDSLSDEALVVLHDSDALQHLLYL